jgi:DNA-binding CsgD family transcriptional regulator
VAKRQPGQTKDLANGAAQRRKQILELRVQGKTHAEIGRLLGCSRKTISKVLERARKKQVAS